MVPHVNNLDSFSAMKYSVQWNKAEDSKNMIMEMLGGYIYLALDWNENTESL